MLRDQYMMREDKYPSDLNEAYELLNHFVTANNIPAVKGGTRKDKEKANEDDAIIRGAQYLQQSKRGLTPGRD